MNIADILTAVDTAFENTGHGLEPWPDPHPHPHHQPLDEEYSRVTNPGRLLIIGARFEAWSVALVELGLAVAEPDVQVEWTTPPLTVVSRTDRLRPVRAGALPIVASPSRVGDADGVGLIVGVGDPAHCLGWLPHCGCDACDDGSDSELDQLDNWIRSIVTGTFRRLTRGDNEITFVDNGWSGNVANVNVERVLADPRGWAELSGPSWLS